MTQSRIIFKGLIVVAMGLFLLATPPGATASLPLFDSCNEVLCPVANECSETIMQDTCELFCPHFLSAGCKEEDPQCEGEDEVAVVCWEWPD